MTRESAMDLVRKLLQNQGRTPEESAAFAAKAADIMDRFHFQADDIDFEAQQKEADAEPIMDFGYEDPMDAKAYMWMCSLAQVVAKHFDCQTIRRSNGGGKYAVRIFGRPSDVQMSRYLYGYLLREINRLAKEKCKGHSNGYLNQFNIGAVTSVGQTLLEQRKKTMEAVRGEAANGMALVRVNNAIVKRERLAVAVSDFMNQKVPGLRSGRGLANVKTMDGAAARAAGFQAGKTIRINAARGSLGSGVKHIGN